MRHFRLVAGLHQRVHMPKCRLGIYFRKLQGKVAGMTAVSVRDNKAQSRFELDAEGAVAFANYRRTPSAVIITTPRRRAPCVAAALRRNWWKARCG
jgi:hypothetical protein